MKTARLNPGAGRQWGIFLFLFSLVLIYGVFFMGTPVSQESSADRRHRDIFLLLTGILGMAGALFPAGSTGLRRLEDRVAIGAALAIPGYVLLQLIPMPSALVGILSPARAELLRGLEPLYGHRAFAGLSIAPSAAFSHFLLISAYCVLLLAAREFSIRAGERIWLVAAPVVLAAAIEAASGLIQFFAPGNIQVKGTYAVRNHLAGLLEMALPLAAMYAVSAFQTARSHSAWKYFVRSGVGAALAALLLAGAFCTLSRGGFVSILVSALAMSALAIGRDLPLQRRLAAIALVCLLCAGAFFYLTPVSLIARLSQHTSEGRLTLWREALGVVREYPLTGTGLGGFESAFLKFKASEGMFLVDYAHNDYLQLLIELGAAGFLLVAALIAAVVMRSARKALESSNVRWVGLGCLGSLAAILVHSTVDFNFYVAANTAVLAWICGIAAGIRRSTPHLARRRMLAPLGDWSR